MNPAFTVIDFDEEYMVPLNAHVYIMNLTEANANPDQKPVWFELHDLLEEYSMPDLSPNSVKDLIDRMYNDIDLASQYEWNAKRRAS
jgi:hypothetical protein